MSSATMETERSPAPSRMLWRSATVLAICIETPAVTTLVLEVPGWPGHVAGQHVDIRLTASDGYQAQRSYSIASAPDGSSKVEVTVQNVDAGEVSPFLTGEVAVGDVLELRGPAGDYFKWYPCSNEPLFLVAGGSGILPLMAILRTRAQAGASTAAVLLYSSRDYESIIFREELEHMAAQEHGFTLIQTLTRKRPIDWDGECGRIDQAMLERAGSIIIDAGTAFVCGPTAMVEVVATKLVTLGFPEHRIKTERFGPTT